MDGRVMPMTRKYAEEISRWTYEGAYSVYSFDASEETIEELLNGDYAAFIDSSGLLAGYFCTGFSARIPTREVYDDGDDRLDIGLGMKPELCGRGLGFAFMRFGMDYLKRMYGEKKLRLAVAAFNRQAISVYEKHGFSIRASVTHRNTGKPFYIMEREAPVSRRV